MAAVANGVAAILAIVLEGREGCSTVSLPRVLVTPPVGST